MSPVTVHSIYISSQRVMHQSADNADTVLPLVSEVVRVLSTQYTVQCNIALLLKVIELVIAATSQIGTLKLPSWDDCQHPTSNFYPNLHKSALLSYYT